MGLLGDIYSFGNRAKRTVKGLLSDPIGTVQQSVGELTDNVKEYNRLNKIAWESKDPVAQRQAEDQVNKMTLNGLLNFAPIGMTVWHGSPHKFSKFDMSKIGTGEGAQAYGHGLYMAENPNIAASYQEKLSKIPLDGGYDSMQRFLTYGKTKPRRVDMNAPSNSLTPAETALSYMHMNKGSAFDASQDIRSMIEMMPPDVDKYKKALKILESGKLKRGLLGEDYGNIYKVDIPDEAVSRFLDWDKPLSQQAPEVLSLAKKHVPDLASRKNYTEVNGIPYKDDEFFEAFGMQSSDVLGNPELLNSLSKKFGAIKVLPVADDIAQSLTGQDLYKLLSSNKGSFEITGPNAGRNSPVSADILRANGIPGIRYLDGGSRSAGQGSSNFVLFDDQLPRILETNGVPTGLQPWQPGEWQGLLR